MTTPRSRALVSLAFRMTLVTLALGGCAPSRPVLAGPAPTEDHRLAIRFDNGAREHVHVYLVDERREWLLGRVEPGAVATLRIPEASIAGSVGFMRLAVITGERLTLKAALDPRATFTIAQPAAAILSEHWTFSQGQLTPLQVRH